MNVVTLRVRLNLRQARTLKDKRQVVRSVLARLRTSFNISVAEIDARDHPQAVVLGLACVAEEAGAARATLEEVANALRAHPVAEFVAAEWDV